MNVTNHLDFREKGGYRKTNVTFYPEDKTEKEFNLDIYIATEDNPLFLGPAHTDEIAKQIYMSVGPSGKNTEYLFELAQAVRSLMPQDTDEHLFALEHAVKSLCERG